LLHVGNFLRIFIRATAWEIVVPGLVIGVILNFFLGTDLVGNTAHLSGFFGGAALGKNSWNFRE
jgi:hypothetical protein